MDDSTHVAIVIKDSLVFCLLTEQSILRSMHLKNGVTSKTAAIFLYKDGWDFFLFLLLEQFWGEKPKSSYRSASATEMDACVRRSSTLASHGSETQTAMKFPFTFMAIEFIYKFSSGIVISPPIVILKGNQARFPPVYGKLKIDVEISFFIVYPQFLFTLREVPLIFTEFRSIRIAFSTQIVRRSRNKSLARACHSFPRRSK